MVQKSRRIDKSTVFTEIIVISTKTDNVLNKVFPDTNHFDSVEVVISN